MVKDLKETVVEQGDTIALFVTAIIAIILVSAEILPERFVSISLLLILCLLALHHLRRTFRIEKMHKQIEEISGTVKTLRGTAKLLLIYHCQQVCRKLTIRFADKMETTYETGVVLLR